MVLGREQRRDRVVDGGDRHLRGGAVTRRGGAVVTQAGWLIAAVAEGVSRARWGMVSRDGSARLDPRLERDDVGAQQLVLKG